MDQHSMKYLRVPPESYCLLTSSPVRAAVCCSRRYRNRALLVADWSHPVTPCLSCLVGTYTRVTDPFLISLHLHWTSSGYKTTSVPMLMLQNGRTVLVVFLWEPEVYPAADWSHDRHQGPGQDHHTLSGWILSNVIGSQSQCDTVNGSQCCYIVILLLTMGGS